MKYQKGQKLYRHNKKTNEIEEVTIVDILYKLDKSINSTYNHSESSIDELVEKGKVSTDIDIVKLNAIRQLEKQFNIKLKEVK